MLTTAPLGSGFAHQEVENRKIWALGKWCGYLAEAKAASFEPRATSILGK